jgi:hypothetical protein
LSGEGKYVSGEGKSVSGEGKCVSGEGKVCEWRIWTDTSRKDDGIHKTIYEEAYLPTAM